MPSPRHLKQLLVVWLTLACLLYRGLIPAGYMPAVGTNAATGALLVVCHHGDLVTPDHDGKGGSFSVDQCPFGVAAGPALPSQKLAFVFTTPTETFVTEWHSGFDLSVSQRLRPPARAPPIFS